MRGTETPPPGARSHADKPASIRCLEDTCRGDDARAQVSPTVTTPEAPEAQHSASRGAGRGKLPISSCPGYFPLTRCRTVFLSWSRSVVAEQARTPPAAVHPLHSFRQPFLRAACGMTESPGSETRLAAQRVPSTGT